ncbi:MAG: LysR family transcriptional regulator [Eubacteriales bacterium]|nr:LysR family transcriptional regulator [Eubacteriales bacterium]
MELRHLRYFNEVATEMNFTRAAEKLNIAQPPLSKQIKDLEEELGVELFVRRPHYLALTPEGEMLKQYAAQIIALADKAAETVREMGQGLNGTIYIATVEGHTLRMLSRYISEFSTRYPSVQYNLWTGSADEVMVRVKNGLCDFAILADIKDTEGVEYYNLVKERWTALIPASNPLASLPGNEIAARELLPFDLILPSRSERFNEVSNWFRDSEVKPKVRCRYTNVLSAYELSRQSVGISIYPGETDEILGFNSNDEVIVKMISNPTVTSTYVMLYNINRVLPHVVNEFIDFILDENKVARPKKRSGK